MTAINWTSTNLGAYSFNDAQALQERVIGVCLIDYGLFDAGTNLSLAIAMRFRTLSETADPATATLRIRQGGTAPQHFGKVVTSEATDGNLLDQFNLAGAWIGAWDDFGADPPPSSYPGTYRFNTLMPRPSAGVEQLTFTLTGISSLGVLDQALETIGLNLSVMDAERTWRVPLVSPNPRTEPNGTSQLGVDVACVDDVDSTFSLAAAVPNLAMALLRRLITRRGGLFYARDYGFDLRAFVHAGVSDAQIATLPEQIRLEVEKDERVQSASVRVSYSRQAQRLKASIVVRTSVGPFRMIVSVDQLTAELLAIGNVSAAA